MLISYFQHCIWITCFPSILIINIYFFSYIGYIFFVQDEHNISIFINHVFLSMMDSKMAIDGFSYHLFLCDDDQFTWINLSMWMSPLGSIWYGIILSIRVHDLWTCVHLQSSFVPEGRWYDMMIIMDGNRWINMK